MKSAHHSHSPFALIFSLFISLFLAWPAFAEQAGLDAVLAGSGVEDLGGGRYRLGRIEIDQNRGRIEVPGKINRHQGPFEFLATTAGGQKSYESLVELDSNAHNFNLACILIGLDSRGSTRPKMHFDETPVEGDPVDIDVSWTASEKAISVKAAELFLSQGKPVKSHRWRYTGSYFGPDGQYMAEEFGTLIGFVHDEDSIIHHREGLGLNDYGGVSLNHDLVPAVGQPVVIAVTRRRK